MKVRSVKGYEGLYVISRSGIVYNVKTKKEIKQHLNNTGYMRVGLGFKGKKTFLVHRLVAIAYIPNPLNLPVINHKDGNKLNNNVDNLEWATQSSNQIHAYRTGLQVGYCKPGMKLSKKHRDALVGSRWKNYTRFYILSGRKFTRLKEASSYFGVSKQTILNRCNSPNWPDWEMGES